MAQIDRKALAKALAANYPVTVGDNRQVYNSPRDGAVYGLLHGHRIVTLKGNTLTLDPCGYHTTTTRQAMHDLIEAVAKRPVRVSFAKGEFTAALHGEEFQPDANGRIAIEL